MARLVGTPATRDGEGDPGLAGLADCVLDHNATSLSFHLGVD